MLQTIQARNITLQRRFWVLVIESKRQDFSLSVGVAQILAYMVANPDLDKPTLGLLTNGGEFQFVKLTRQGKPQYAFSQSFNLRNPGNDLYSILSILKRLAQIMSI